MSEHRFHPLTDQDDDLPNLIALGAVPPVPGAPVPAVSPAPAPHAAATEHEKEEKEPAHDDGTVRFDDAFMAAAIAGVGTPAQSPFPFSRVPLSGEPSAARAHEPSPLFSGHGSERLRLTDKPAGAMGVNFGTFASPFRGGQPGEFKAPAERGRSGSADSRTEPAPLLPESAVVEDFTQGHREESDLDLAELGQQRRPGRLVVSMISDEEKKKVRPQVRAVDKEAATPFQDQGTRAYRYLPMLVEYENARCFKYGVQAPDWIPNIWTLLGIGAAYLVYSGTDLTLLMNQGFNWIAGDYARNLAQAEEDWAWVEDEKQRGVQVAEEAILYTMRDTAIAAAEALKSNESSIAWKLQFFTILVGIAFGAKFVYQAMWFFQGRYPTDASQQSLFGRLFGGGGDGDDGVSQARLKAINYKLDQLKERELPGVEDRLRNDIETWGKEVKLHVTNRMAAPVAAAAGPVSLDDKTINNIALAFKREMGLGDEFKLGDFFSAVAASNTSHGLKLDALATQNAALIEMMRAMQTAQTQFGQEMKEARTEITRGIAGIPQALDARLREILEAIRALDLKVTQFNAAAPGQFALSVSGDLKALSAQVGAGFQAGAKAAELTREANAIRDAIGGIAASVSAALPPVNFDALYARLEQIEGRIGGRFDHVDTAIDGLPKAVAQSVSSAVDLKGLGSQIAGRFDKVDSALGGLGSELKLKLDGDRRVFQQLGQALHADIYHARDDLWGHIDDVPPRVLQEVHNHIDISTGGGSGSAKELSKHADITGIKDGKGRYAECKALFHEIADLYLKGALRGEQSKVEQIDDVISIALYALGVKTAKALEYFTVDQMREVLTVIKNRKEKNSELTLGQLENYFYAERQSPAEVFSENDWKAYEPTANRHRTGGGEVKSRFAGGAGPADPSAAMASAVSKALGSGKPGSSPASMFARSGRGAPPVPEFSLDLGAAPVTSASVVRPSPLSPLPSRSAGLARTPSPAPAAAVPTRTGSPSPSLRRGDDNV